MSSPVSKDAKDLAKEISSYLDEWPPREVSMRFVAGFLCVSQPTIERWSQGRNLPYPATAKAVLTSLRKLVDFKRVLSQAKLKYPRDNVKRIAHVAGVSFPTVRRWFSGENFPHPEMMEAIVHDIKKDLL